MSVEHDIDPRLFALLKPYLGEVKQLTSDTSLVKDLRVTGSDYLAFINDLECEISTDMTEFLMGDDPKFVSTGIAGIFLGKRKMPVFRDVTVAELNEFLRQTDQQKPTEIGKTR